MTIADHRRHRRQFHQVGFSDRQHGARACPGDKIGQPGCDQPVRTPGPAPAMTRGDSDGGRITRDAMHRNIMLPQLSRDRQGDGIFHAKEENAGQRAHAGISRCS